MLRDFTFDDFKEILINFKNSGYFFLTFYEYCSNNKSKSRQVILRHDVDRYPLNALKMAELEYDLDLKATYFFRTIPSVFDHQIIKKIASLGHEIGYHYEDLSQCNGDPELAIIQFSKNLEKLRKLFPVKSICMHGSPLSKWNNKDIWNFYDYKKFEITGDTSLDLNYNEVFYITDNGRGWNRTNVSIRDKVSSNFDIQINGSSHFKSLINENLLPDKLMLNVHPDTFFDYGIKYYLNFLLIEFKNLVKWIFVKFDFRN